MMRWFRFARLYLQWPVIRCLLGGHWWSRAALEHGGGQRMCHRCKTWIDRDGFKRMDAIGREYK